MNPSVSSLRVLCPPVIVEGKILDKSVAEIARYLLPHFSHFL
jgi:hypothetical protein